MISTHTDVIGSLLRPHELLEARKAVAAGGLPRRDFKAIEDRAVDQAVALQEQAGLEIVTDGEMRRLSFQSQMTEAVDGFGDCGLDAFLWGEWHGDAVAGSWSKARPRGLGVVDRLKRKRHLSVEEFVYLRSRTTRTPKVTLPSPSLFANLWSPAVSRGAYPTLEGFLADVAEILREEVEELTRLGATYIQIDAPHYTLLLEPKTRAFYESRGWQVDQWLSLGIELDNAVMVEDSAVTFGFHLCRGNQASRWLVEGGYELIAQPIFKKVRAQRLLLEYDDLRSGSFEPLQEVPNDKMLVLGLVTTKRPELENPEALRARVREASRFVPLERLALSPQCGFATSIVGNKLTVEDQRRKLELVASTARDLWG